MTTESQALMRPLWMSRAGGHPWIARGALILVGTALLALSARVQVPMWPVPVTMQTFAVLVIALAGGARIAATIVAAYLLEGAIGLPVFAAGGGVAYLTGPTAGYLYGFLAAALVAGHLADRGWARGIVGAGAASVVAMAVIYALGASWLAVFVGVEAALVNGVAPFLPGDALKIALAAVALPAAGRFMGRAG
ncbi:biotin transporter BioY [Rhodobacteraceae bacterium WD3A24]|nr:biotin transporter BioY [Rhodobacteraceae bacterium WD3A24]